MPTRLIAEKFTEYYWRQAVPYIPPGSSGEILRQNTGGPAAVLTHLAKAGGTESSLPAMKRDPRLWNKLLNKIDAVVRKMPSGNCRLSDDRSLSSYTKTGKAGMRSN